MSGKVRKVLLYFVLVATTTITFMHYAKFRGNQMDWDVFGYYLYLPAYFIHHDMDLDTKEEWIDPLIDKYRLTDYFYQAYVGPEGKYVFKYSMGLAFLYTPFFLAADQVAINSASFERDGFSKPYQVAMQFFNLFMIWLGLFLAFKILLLFFSETISFITLLLLIFGSNFFVITFWSGLMPHLPLFTIFSLLLYCTIRWYANPKLKYAVLAGLCLGLSMLIRPTGIVVILVPLLWGVYNKATFISRVQIFKEKWYHLVILGFIAFVVLIPQLVYWYRQTGQWLFYSYPDEGLNLLLPKLGKVFFSYKKGWLVYTPLMAFVLAGFVPLWKNHKPIFYPIFIFFIINTWVIASWDNWWYGGSFAHRAFVESYIFMAFPLAAFMERISRAKIAYRVTVTVACLFFIFLNIFQTRQALDGVIHTTRTNKEYYWKVFMKKSASAEDKLWLSPEPYFSGEDYYDPAKNPVVTDSFSLVSEIASLSEMYSDSWQVRTDLYDHFRKRVYLKLSAEINPEDLTSAGSISLIAETRNSRSLFIYRSKPFEVVEDKPGIMTVNFTFHIPPLVSKYPSTIKTYVYNPDNHLYTLRFVKAYVIETDL